MFLGRNNFGSDDISSSSFHDVSLDCWCHHIAGKRLQQWATKSHFQGGVSFNPAQCLASPSSFSPSSPHKLFVYWISENWNFYTSILSLLSLFFGYTTVQQKLPCMWHFLAEIVHIKVVFHQAAQLGIYFEEIKKWCYSTRDLFKDTLLK